MKIISFILIIFLSFFTFGCRDEDSGRILNEDSESSNGKWVVNLLSDSIVNVKNTQPSGSISLASSIVIPVDCLDPNDVDSGIPVPISNDKDKCIKYVSKAGVNDSAGMVIWSDLTQEPTIPMAIGDGLSCGIITDNGEVRETVNCPEIPEGFKNERPIFRYDTGKLRGLSGGKYYEYSSDPSDDTETIILEEIDPIARVDELTELTIYKAGGTVKRLYNGETFLLPELDDRSYHKIGELIQRMSGNEFERGSFINGEPSGVITLIKSDGTVYNFDGIDYPPFAPFRIPSVPQKCIDSNLTDCDGPILNTNLQNCDHYSMNGVNVMLCNGQVLKYGGENDDLILVNLCSLGSCGSSDSVGCLTNDYYFTFASGIDIATDEYNIARLTRMDIINNTYSNIYNIQEIGGELSQEQIDDYFIREMSCGPNSVTASTDVKTILITNANTSADMSILDIEAESVVQ